MALSHVFACVGGTILFAMAGAVAADSVDGGVPDETAILARFGEPKVIGDYGDAKMWSFAKDGFEVIVQLYQGQPCLMVFRPEDGGTLSDRKQLAILQRNFPGLHWSEQPPTVGAGAASTEWRSGGAWKGDYANGILAIENPELQDLYEKKFRAYCADHPVDWKKLLPQHPTP